MNFNYISLEIILSLIGLLKDVRQGLIMHLFDILSFPLHPTPPCLGEGLLQSLIFFFHPSPHVLLHLPKGPQDPHRPFTKLIKLDHV